MAFLLSILTGQEVETSAARKQAEAGERIFKLLKDIGRIGIQAGVSDDQYLMATLAGMSPREFRDKNRDYFFTGDAEATSETLKKINENALMIKSLA